MTSRQRCLSMVTLNPRLIELEYAVRGPLPIRSLEIQKELKEGAKKPFTEVIRANVGDCHAMGQVPLTFLRQVLALVTYPAFLESPEFPDDAKERARAILNSCQGGSVGSYTDSSGLEIVRKQVAKYIEARDGVPADWQNVIVSGGASDAIRKVLRLFMCDVDGKKSGVMVPIPQYPLYSASLTEFGLSQINYYLDESKNWSLEITELKRAVDEAKKVCKPRAIVVINPGNPTGQVLSRQNIEEIIKFAYEENLYILADEVYQDNVYAEGCKFYSFKKVLTELGEPYNTVELASFMSCSKGYMGECGFRAGYAEVINMCPEVKAMYLKGNSAMLCSSVIGQACLYTITNPPQKGEPSYESFQKEKSAVLESLKLRAKMAADTFNSMEAITCNATQGAMYAFPQLHLPPKAIEAAKKQGKEPDVFYAFELLENTGICVVPGSGFGQETGTHHFRTTILLQTEKFKTMLEKFAEFHTKFIKTYS
ncbi:alanine aminotransferase 2-like [Rhynchophorus ferrugineus]|uniref:alanine aminotransferase 2-like n=1 Tax=Rhynchophorus ferrugineus TaxID=354439 RepID=UPI003FCDD9E4